MGQDLNLDRRDFLRSSVLGAGALGTGALGPLGSPLGSVFSGLQVRGDKILVIVQLSGGNDGLNTLVPFDNDDYHRGRPRLRQKKATCLKLASGIGLHGAMKQLKAIYDDGDLAILQGVGYPNPNRSHFKSMDIWHSADVSDRPKKSGWLGRLADLTNRRKDDADYTVNISAQPPLALQGKDYRPISFRDPNQYRFDGSQTQMKAFEKITTRARQDANEMLELLGKTAEDARKSSEQIRAAARAYSTPVRYPQGGRGAGASGSLRSVAAMINAGLSTRVFYVYHNGYDTHNNQAGRHNNLLTQLSQALFAFQQDLKRLRADDRVCTFVFSEFGRRVRENASAGTDHGAGGLSFLMGGKVKGGLHGKMPSLTDLDRGDLKYNLDFRRIYATLLREWLGADAREVLGGHFEKLPLLKA
ncbi:MAG: DUF1501 domain-containing protein [Planctomycetota bacterium]|jgi:uncharacterized protein (DUF1501 family)